MIENRVANCAISAFALVCVLSSAAPCVAADRDATAGGPSFTSREAEKRDNALDLYFDRCPESAAEATTQLALADFDVLLGLHRPELDVDDIHEAAKRLGRREVCQQSSFRTAILTSDLGYRLLQRNVLLTLGLGLLGTGVTTIVIGLIISQLGHGLNSIYGGISALGYGFAASGFGTGFTIAGLVRSKQVQWTEEALQASVVSAAIGSRVTVRPGFGSLQISW